MNQLTISLQSSNFSPLLSHQETILTTMQVSAFSEGKTEILEDFGGKLKLNVPHERQIPKLKPEEEQEQEQSENEEEFSFACASPVHSPISADDIFVDGQIRPIFPIIDRSFLYHNGDGVDDSKQTLRPPMRKLFVEELSDPEEEQPVGPFCEWSSGGNKTVKEATLGPCKKSNSTGFSRLWRFRELVLRSNSDGKDAFVFLNNHNKNDTCEAEEAEKSSERPERSKEKQTGTKTTPGQKTSKGEKGEKVTAYSNNKSKRVKQETVSSVYEKYYARNRGMREGDKRRSYAPYKQDLVGFFTNVNGFSRNVHPF